MSFVIPRKIISDIDSLFQKRDYKSEEKKVQIAKDFIVAVDGKRIRFFATESASLVFLIADYDFPEKDLEKYVEFFRDGILPFSSLESLHKVVKVLGNSDYVSFDYEEEISKINIETFGSMKKYIDYYTTPVEDNESFSKYDKFMKSYDIIEDLPSGWYKDDDGELADKYYFDTNVQISGSDLSEIIRDSAVHDTRSFIANIISKDLMYLMAYNNEENGKNAIKYDLKITTDNYVHVGEKEFGFGFSQLVAKFSGTVELFYNKDPDIFMCVLRNNSNDIKYNALINFDVTDDEIPSTSKLDEEEYDFDDSSDDDYGDLDED